jgi:hypothetical protein
MAVDGEGEPDTFGALATANEELRDAIAFLEFLQSSSAAFQQNRAAGVDMSMWRFGLETEIGRAQEWSWFTTLDGRPFGAATRVYGSTVAWSFSAAEIRRYRAHKLFRYIDGALRAADEQRSDWQRRVVVALRTWAAANYLTRPSTRTVLAATALEVLLGDSYLPGARATGAFRLSQRAAYLWCSAGRRSAPTYHGPDGRPLCPSLAAKNRTELQSFLKGRKEHGEQWECDWFDALMRLYDARNKALHGAVLRDSPQVADVSEQIVEQVLQRVIVWAASHPDGGLGALDAEIAAQPRDFTSPVVDGSARS